MNEKDNSKKNYKGFSGGSHGNRRYYRKKQHTNDAAAQTVPAVIEPDTAKPSRSRQSKEIRRTPIKIIPLGGLNEIGKNMTVFECWVRFMVQY